MPLKNLNAVIIARPKANCLRAGDFVRAACINVLPFALKKACAKKCGGAGDFFCRDIEYPFAMWYN